MDKIISANELGNIYQNDNVVILDASWYLPNDSKNGFQEYLKNHIPNAQFYDVGQDLPSAENFQKDMQKRGVNKNSSVVIYDRVGYFSAPRLYFLLRYFGHEKTAILDGGFNAWTKPTESGEAPVQQGDFVASENKPLVATYKEILDNLGNELVLDARAEARFLGTAPEPREGLRAGHIPHSKNMPYNKLFNGENGTFKTPDELRKIMADLLPNNKSQPITCSCGSGVTACTVLFALEILGYENTRLYDGSWAEWGANHKLPIE